MPVYPRPSHSRSLYLENPSRRREPLAAGNSAEYTRHNVHGAISRWICQYTQDLRTHVLYVWKIQVEGESHWPPGIAPSTPGITYMERFPGGYASIPKTFALTFSLFGKSK